MADLTASVSESHQEHDVFQRPEPRQRDGSTTKRVIAVPLPDENASNEKRANE